MPTRLLISEYALRQRVDRQLRKSGKRLRMARSESTEISAGRYYIVDTRNQCVAVRNVNLESLGRELGVVHPWETVEH
jgi:hypothetical protein